MSRIKADLMRAFMVLMLTLTTALGASTALAQGQPEAIKIVVLPFEVRADNPDLAYLRQDLPRLLADELAKQGFALVDIDAMVTVLEREKIEFLDLAAAKDMALLTGAKYAVYGTFTQVGDGISLDVRLVDAFGLRPAKPLFVVQDGLINVLPAIEDLSEKVRLELMRKQQVAVIEVVGAEILEKDVVLMNLNIAKGDIYDPKAVNKDVKRIYDLGYFDDVSVTMDELPDGIKLTFTVKEKPRIKAVNVLGAEELDAEDILDEMVTKAGAVLNPKVISEDLGKIRELYRKDGYYKVEVSYELEQADPRQAALNIKIKEGPKLYIQKVEFEGVNQLDPDDVREELMLEERGMFSWLTGTGILKEEYLLKDAQSIEAYYANQGFLDVRVGQPDVQFKDDGIYVTFKVVEGSRYRLGEVRFRGELLADDDTLYGLIETDDAALEGDYFNRSQVSRDRFKLVEYYNDFGFAFAEAAPFLDSNSTTQTVDVIFQMTRKEKIYVRRVHIEGNLSTRDNVIRRELRLSDGDLYSGSKKNRSLERLYRKDFYEQADIDIIRVDDDEVDLKVKVSEKPTGQLSAGLGYSSYSKVFLALGLQQRNLFGKGYYLGLTGTWSTKNMRYNLAFTNPNFNDTKLSVGGDLYYDTDEWDEYDKDTIGGRARFGYPLGEYTSAHWHYQLDRSVIKDVDSDASQDVKDVEGTRWGSSVYGDLVRDTTDRYMNPSKGNKSSISMEYSGGILQGNDDFIKYVADTSQYWPVWLKHIVHAHAQAGYIQEQFGGEDIPVYERFYLGGINTVRGYHSGYISPFDAATGDRTGGNKRYFGNLEYLVPLYEDLGLMGLTFVDAGEVADIGDEFDFDPKKSVGFGVRWFSPMGPLRLEYGYRLDDVHDQDKSDGIMDGQLEFSIGQFF